MGFAQSRCLAEPYDPPPSVLSVGRATILGGLFDDPPGGLTFSPPSHPSLISRREVSHSILFSNPCQQQNNWFPNHFDRVSLSGFLTLFPFRCAQGIGDPGHRRYVSQSRRISFTHWLPTYMLTLMPANEESGQISAAYSTVVWGGLPPTGKQCVPAHSDKHTAPSGLPRSSLECCRPDNQT